jgi:type IV pilus assembly protein PilO
MAGLPQDRRGQTLLLTTVLALVVAYFGYSGMSFVGLQGIKPMGVHRDSMQVELESLTVQVGRVKRDLATGSLQQLESRMAEFKSSLDLMRQLVPTSAEVPNLLDDISSRAKIRGTTLAGFLPLSLESGTPFDTQRYRLTIAGRYDQIGEFLTDIASLPRIIVPYDIHLQHVTGPAAAADTAKSLLQATFAIRTYIKPAEVDTSTTPNAPPPAARPRAAPQGAAPRGDDE